MLPATPAPLAHAAVPDGADLPALLAEVAYHSRERLPDARPGEKAVSAPGVDTEALPAARLLADRSRRVIEGRVPRLPYTFYVRLSRPALPGAEPLLEVNVVGKDGHALPGFPKRSEHPVTEQVIFFELLPDEAAKRQAAGTLTEKLAFRGDGSFNPNPVARAHGRRRRETVRHPGLVQQTPRTADHSRGELSLS